MTCTLVMPCQRHTMAHTQHTRSSLFHCRDLRMVRRLHSSCARRLGLSHCDLPRRAMGLRQCRQIHCRGRQLRALQGSRFSGSRQARFRHLFWCMFESLHEARTRNSPRHPSTMYFPLQNRTTRNLDRCQWRASRQPPSGTPSDEGRSRACILRMLPHHN